jgi:cytoskeletal protein CcmA (bactofilin family)
MTKAAELAKIVDASGNVVTSGTVEPAGDTAAGDNAAIGFTSAEGIVITGQGSTNDVTIKNDADADVIEIPTGTTNVTVAGTLTATGFIIGSADINENDLESIDGITAGTIAASKAAIVDTNKDITGFRNITLTGELDAATLDVSGDADIDGTLEADAITVNGTALATVIAGTTVTTATNANHVSVADNESTNEENLIPFIEDTSATGNVGLESDGDFAYNPSTGTVSATVFKGNIDAVDGDFDGTLEADAITIGGTAIASVLSPVAGSSSIVTTGALNSGSITSGFGTIDTGSSNITSTGVGAFGSLDISGDIDVDGTTNLDVVDIDGAVDMASTLNVTGAITSSAGATITTADNTAQLTLISTDADASKGPVLDLTRNSASPANNDVMGRIRFKGENSADEEVSYAFFESQVKDVTDGAEDGNLSANILINGTHREVLTLTRDSIVINQDSQDLDFRVESNSNTHMLFVDGGNDIVAIGKSSNDTVGGFKNALQVEGTGATSSSISVTRNTNDSNPAYLQFGKSRGTSVGSNTILQNGDEIAQITFNAADGTNRDTPAASIRCSIDATPGENDMPGRLMFFTTADGASSSTERVRIHSGGQVSIPGGIELGSGLDGTNANTLDDYEEGTWTPTDDSDSGGSITAFGRYTKVGRQVTIHFTVRIDNTFSEHNRIGGLPFAPVQDVTLTSVNGMFVMRSNNRDLYGHLISGATYFQLMSNLTATAATPSTSDGTLRGNFTYQAS